MELFLISMAIIGVATTVTAIDECINWMDSYRRAGEEDQEDRERYAQIYAKFSEQGHQE